MEITDVQIDYVHEGIVMAFASVTLGDAFVVHGLKVIEGPCGRIVTMPSRQQRSGRSQDIAHPLGTQARDYVERKVLEAYDGHGGAEGSGVGAPLRPSPPTLVGKAALVVPGREAGEAEFRGPNAEQLPETS